MADNTSAITYVAATDPTIEPVPCQDATTVGSAVRYFFLLHSFFATFFECYITDFCHSFINLQPKKELQKTS